MKLNNVLDIKRFKKMRNKNHWIIYCDLDGVLCDWDKQLYAMFLNKFNRINKTNIKYGWDFEKIYGSDLFWEYIRDLGVEFWSEMPWTNDGEILWNYVKNYNVKILSKPSRDETSKIGKIIWCERELGKNQDVILSRNKEDYAGPNTILIDDFIKNCESFSKSGGISILHKSAKETIKELDKLL